jgi:hypothetical protein
VVTDVEEEIGGQLNCCNIIGEVAMDVKEENEYQWNRGIKVIGGQSNHCEVTTKSNSYEGGSAKRNQLVEESGHRWNGCKENDGEANQFVARLY